MTGSRAAVVTLPADTQILITRDFDAPRHLVFLAWTTPAGRTGTGTWSTATACSKRWTGSSRL